MTKRINIHFIVFIFQISRVLIALFLTQPAPKGLLGFFCGPRFKRNLCHSQARCIRECYVNSFVRSPAKHPLFARKKAAILRILHVET